MTLATRLGYVVGAAMLALGGYVALRPLWNAEPVTGQRFLDLAFAFFFLVKGGLYFRRPRRRAPPPTPDAPPAAPPS